MLHRILSWRMLAPCSRSFLEAWILCPPYRGTSLRYIKTWRPCTWISSLSILVILRARTCFVLCLSVQSSTLGLSIRAHTWINPCLQPSSPGIRMWGSSLYETRALQLEVATTKLSSFSTGLLGLLVGGIDGMCYLSLSVTDETTYRNIRSHYIDRSPPQCSSHPRQSS